MTDYTIKIVITGSDQGATTLLNKVGVGLGSIGTIAGGILSANAIQSIGQQVVNLGAAGLDSYRFFERLGLSLNTLTAKEAMAADGTLSMEQALSKTAESSKELLGWTEKLAIKSPFNQEGIASAFQMQLGFGFTTKEAQRLTQVMVDYVAGSGRSVDTMRSVSLALGQIQAKGKLAGQEVMQLTEAGISVDKILAQSFGKSTAEIVKMREKGLIPADKAIEAIVSSLEKDFSGAATRSATSFDGLITSLDEVKSMGLRELLSDSFQAAQPYIASFVDKFADPAFRQSIRDVGAGLGNVTTNVLKFASSFGSLNFGSFDLLGNLFPETKAPFSKLTLAFQDFINMLRSDFAPQLQSLGANMWADLFDFGKIGLPTIIANMSDALTGITSIWRTHGDTIMTVVRGAWNVVISTIGGAFILISGAVSAGVAWISGLMDAFSLLFQGNYTQAFYVFAQGVVEAIGIMLSTFNVFMDFVLNVFGTNLTTFNAVWASNWTMLSIITTALWNQITTTLITGFNNVVIFITTGLENIRAIWNAIWNGILTLLSTIWSTIYTVITTTWDAIIDFLLGNLTSFGIDYRTGWSGISDVVSAILSSMATYIVSEMKSALANVLLSINNLKTQGQVAIEALYTIWKAQTANIVKAWEAVTEAIEAALYSAKNTLEWAKNNVITFFTQTVDLGTSTTVKTAPKNVGDNIAGGINIGAGMATGGNVFPGNLYPVGEAGIELFAPNTSGQIISNRQIAQALGKMDNEEKSSGRIFQIGNVTIADTGAGLDDFEATIKRLEFFYA